MTVLHMIWLSLPFCRTGRQSLLLGVQDVGAAFVRFPHSLVRQESPFGSVLFYPLLHPLPWTSLCSTMHIFFFHNDQDKSLFAPRLWVLGIAFVAPFWSDWWISDARIFLFFFRCTGYENGGMECFHRRECVGGHHGRFLRDILYHCRQIYILISWTNNLSIVVHVVGTGVFDLFILIVTILIHIFFHHQGWSCASDSVPCVNLFLA